MRARFAYDLTMFLTALTVFAGLAGGMLMMSHAALGFLFSDLVPNARLHGVSIPGR